MIIINCAYVFFKVRLNITEYDTISGDRKMYSFTFFTASLFFSFLSLFNSDFNSNISPFLVVVKYLLSVILILQLVSCKSRRTNQQFYELMKYQTITTNELTFLSDSKGACFVVNATNRYQYSRATDAIYTEILI